jgi:hypothetical protein
MTQLDRAQDNSDSLRCLPTYIYSTKGDTRINRTDQETTEVQPQPGYLMIPSVSSSSKESSDEEGSRCPQSEH